ncbi:MAG: type II toxin-antitoxin system PemK/MazF family toxin [Candidatus Magasanikbacteria bacterium]|nr:type II toxin-antitoxin system PemK/MazF family toxin [Candidatus Magasanikbacteria bacterium]
MAKNFDEWNLMKKNLHENGGTVFCHEREVWWCSLGVNVGFEQDGTGEHFDRPVVVVRGFNQSIFFGVALTGRKRQGKFYFYLGEIEGRDATAVLSQVRLIDTKRLVRKMETLDAVIFEKLKAELKKVLFD